MFLNKLATVHLPWLEVLYYSKRVLPQLISLHIVHVAALRNGGSSSKYLDFPSTLKGKTYRCFFDALCLPMRDKLKVRLISPLISGDSTHTYIQLNLQLKSLTLTMTDQTVILKLHMKPLLTLKQRVV